MPAILRVCAVAFVVALAACETSGVATSPSSYVPRQASFRCDSGDELTISRAGPALMATDTRGFAATLTASPPGQSTRYAEGIHALILEGRAATWFVSGQRPLECRR